MGVVVMNHVTPGVVIIDPAVAAQVDNHFDI